jgi:hypothetical protein
MSFETILSAETPGLSWTMYVSVVVSAYAGGVGRAVKAASVASTDRAVTLRRRRIRVSFARGLRVIVPGRATETREGETTFT